jgi:hypothetical protein
MREVGEIGMQIPGKCSLTNAAELLYIHRRCNALHFAAAQANLLPQLEGHRHGSKHSFGHKFTH